MIFLEDERKPNNVQAVRSYARSKRCKECEIFIVILDCYNIIDFECMVPEIRMTLSKPRPSQPMLAKEFGYRIKSRSRS